MEKQYLGFQYMTPEMGTEGYGGYCDWIVCKGKDPVEVIKNYFHNIKAEEEFIEANIVIEEDGSFYYHDYFNYYFIELLGDNVYHPGIPILHYDKYNDEDKEIIHTISNNGFK